VGTNTKSSTNQAHEGKPTATVPRKTSGVRNSTITVTHPLTSLPPPPSRPLLFQTTLIVRPTTQHPTHRPHRTAALAAPATRCRFPCRNRRGNRHCCHAKGVPTVGRAHQGGGSRAPAVGLVRPNRKPLRHTFCTGREHPSWARTLLRSQSACVPRSETGRTRLENRPKSVR